MNIQHVNMLKFQLMLDLLAKIIHVPSALIMHLSGDEISVFASSVSEGNPYKVGDKEHFDGSGLYCEYVIKSNDMLLVPNALEDDDWKNNPDVKIDMISYLGLPILLPNGEPFGTICVLDNKTNAYSDLYICLLKMMRDLVEHYLKDVAEAVINARVETLQATVRTVMHLVNNSMNGLNYYLVKMQEGDSFNQDEIDVFRDIIFTCFEKLKELQELEEINIKKEKFGDMIAGFNY